MHDDWRLPLEVPSGAPPAFTWEGAASATVLGGAEWTVFFCCLAAWDSGNLDDLEGPFVLRGTRRPGLIDWPAQTPPAAYRRAGGRLNIK